MIKQCRELLERSLSQEYGDLLDAQQNARLIASAEKYYRVMYYGGAETWNLRDRHMFETLDKLLDAGGRSPGPWCGRTIPMSEMHATPKWGLDGTN